MVDTKQLTTEIKNLLAELKTKISDNDLKTQIDNLDLSEIENLADLTLNEKATLLAAKTQLEKEKNEQKEKLDKEVKEAKEALATLKEKVSDKLTPEFMAKLEALSNKNLELKLIPKKNADGTDLKDEHGNIIYEEILDLNELKTTIAELKKANTEPATNYWSIGTCVLGFLSLGFSIFGLMNEKSKKEPVEKEEASF